MIIKYVTDTETLLEKEMPNKMSKEDIVVLEKFNEMEVISLHYEFVDGVKCGVTHDFDNMKPDMIKQVTIKVKP
jgi:hypothetical protein